MGPASITTNAHYEVIVIGAGFAGLPAAKIYLQLEPSVSLLMIDANRSVGGVWAKERLYPGLRANNLVGTYEYPDFPMHDGFGVKKGEHIPGEVIHEYFRQYADQFDLTRRILLETRVRTVEKTGEGWRLKVERIGKESKDDGHQEGARVITCDKLMVATGLTSSPAPLDLLGSQGFQKPIIRSADLAQHGKDLLEDPSIQHATVLGSGKSAYDCVYLLASSGKRVTWVMRASGHGPTFMAPAHVYIGPFYCWLEMLVSTRLFTWFSPCLWGDADGFGYLRSLLHGTKAGRWFIDKFWKKLGSETVEQAGLNKHEKLKLLQPEAGAMWYATGLGILNYPTNIYDFVTSGQVEVLRKDIERLQGGNMIKFTDGGTVETDALACAMGWMFAPDIEFLPRESHAEFGIPSTALTQSQKEMWDQLNARADLEILDRFPMLAKGPRLHIDSLVAREDLPPAPVEPTSRMKEEHSPWRLWRGLVPPLSQDKNLVFLGVISNLQGAIRNHIVGIWAFAYMNGELDSPRSLSVTTAPPTSKRKKPLVATNRASQAKEGDMSTDTESLLYETALFNRFGIWRTPYGYGARYPDFVFDGLPYFDLLVEDLGLNRWRKDWGWIGEVFGGPYLPRNYEGLLDEWKKRRSIIESLGGQRS
ncbi:hypothetical protein MMC07_001496 [Pseudocyphellaria aurata]|nr:hypothetical protein [Pseudocyphellaria aurata]